MFRRVTVEEWHQIMPFISFGITFIVFIVAVIRALFTRKERCNKLASLPLDQEQNTKSSQP